MKAAIFDFNRTLYQPESGKVPMETVMLLRWLKKRKIALCLISRNEAGRLKKMAEISGFFSLILVVKEKNALIFQNMIETLGIKNNEVLIVGDWYDEEIKIGKSIGAKTLWIKEVKDLEKIKRSFR